MANYVVTPFQLDERRYIPIGTLRSLKEVEPMPLYQVIETGDEWHRIMLPFWEGAEFWDGARWRNVERDWDGWRKEVNASLPPQLWTLPERTLPGGPDEVRKHAPDVTVTMSGPIGMGDA